MQFAEVTELPELPEIGVTKLRMTLGCLGTAQAGKISVGNSKPGTQQPSYITTPSQGNDNVKT